MNTIDVSRFEYKYLLQAEDVPKLRRFLLQYCSPDSNAGGAEWYGIQSLYLDTPGYDFYRASTEGAMERLKLRVRSYTSESGPVKLEIKRRLGDVVNKRSLLISREEWNAFQREGLWSLLQTAPGSLQFVQMVEKLRATPKVLVNYERHAMHSDIDDYVRVTFDRRISCQSMLRWSLEGDQRLWTAVDDPATAPEEHSNYVLEVKFKVAAPLWLRDLVTQFGLVRRGFSKYARAIPRTRPERSSAWDLRTGSVGSPRVWRLA